MNLWTCCSTRSIFLVILCFAAFSSVSAQQPRPASQETEDIIRIDTELVQTDVLVLDRQGHFVDNLPREQFELKVDNKPQAIAFFERVRAGTADEDAQLAAARGTARATNGDTVVHPLDRGRTIFFFLDDVHLSADSLARARKVVLRFVNDEMRANDQVAVASASGRIGFLQQLTNNKAVLRAAIGRLGYRQYVQTNAEFPNISEYQAFAIQEQNDNALFNYKVSELLNSDPLLKPDVAQTMIRTRVQTIVDQSNFYVSGVLGSLESFMRLSAQVPGRKLFYFMSDGFLMNIKSSNVLERMRRITDAAVRSGSVIYTVDARGLPSDTAQDSTNWSSMDLSGTVALHSFGEQTIPQDPLFKLAEDTGGRALVNTNALGAAVSQVLKENSVYYLLAWRPDVEQKKSANKFRQIEVSVKGRPDLKVLVQRGYFDTPPAMPNAVPANNKKIAEKASPPPNELMIAVTSPGRRTALPTSLFVGYTKEPPLGMVLTASVEINDDALSTSDAAAKSTPNSVADVLGVILNDQGKLVNGFKQQLTITPSKQRHAIVASQRLPIAPGIYQVRVSAQDRQSGRTGSASEWIEIPDPAKQQLSLSSIFIGEKQAGEIVQDDHTQQVVVVNPNRRFARNSRLRFNVEIYNATVNARPSPAASSAASSSAAAVGGPDVGVQVQVFRDDQPVVTTPLRKVSTEGLTNFSDIPYAAEILLNDLHAGRYVLRVTIIDRLAKTSASQQIDFAIE